MSNVYDNGYKVLGKVKYVIQYMQENIATSDMEEEIYDIIKELKEYYNEEDIVLIDYDNGMSIYINEVFNKRNLEKVGK